MTKIYSNSKLQLYEFCPEAFKIKYIDKTFPELPKSIVLFLGDLVHQSLEWLYLEIKQGRKVELDNLLFHFVDNWHKNFSASIESIRINEGKPEDYLNRGIKFLMDYYMKNFPFADNTIEIEKRILFPLNGDYLIEGYTDRIVKNNEGEYEIHDYKTNDRLKTQEEVDVDRQLAFYHLGLQELFGRDIKVKLIWHFLAHNKTIVSFRTPAQLDEIKKQTLELIKKIENTAIWPACGSKWCDWCEYKKTRGIKKESFDFGLKRYYRGF